MVEGLSMKKSPSQTMEKSTGRSPASSPSYQYCTHATKATCPSGRPRRHQAVAPGPDADRLTGLSGPGTNLGEQILVELLPAVCASPVVLKRRISVATFYF